MSSENKQQIQDDSHRLYDYPGDLGEHPPVVIGTRHIAVDDLKNEQGFNEAIKSGEVAVVISGLHKKRKVVAADLNIGGITLFVANHRRTIGATAAVVLATGELLYIIHKKYIKGINKKQRP